MLPLLLPAAGAEWGVACPPFPASSAGCSAFHLHGSEELSAWVPGIERGAACPPTPEFHAPPCMPPIAHCLWFRKRMSHRAIQARASATLAGTSAESAAPLFTRTICLVEVEAVCLLLRADTSGRGVERLLTAVRLKEDVADGLTESMEGIVTN